MTTTSVAVRHNFETGHRLPFMEGKCQSLHGHSWWAEVTVTAPDTPLTVVEFGAFKKNLREWIDTYLDHGLMLGQDDPLVPFLKDRGKVYVFTGSAGMWPTVENVALLLSHVATMVLGGIDRAGGDVAPGAMVTRVEVRETHVNKAVWEFMP